MNNSTPAEAPHKAADRAKLLVDAALEIKRRAPHSCFLIDGAIGLPDLVWTNKEGKEERRPRAKRPISLKGDLKDPRPLKQWQELSLSEEDLGKSFVREALVNGHMIGIRMPILALLLGIDIDGHQNKQATRKEYLDFLMAKLGNPIAWKESESPGKEETSAHAWWEVTAECATYYANNSRLQPDAWHFKGKEAGDIRFARNNQMALHGDEVKRIADGLRCSLEEPLSLQRVQSFFASVSNAPKSTTSNKGNPTASFSLKGICEAISSAKEGTRNKTLFKEACKAFRKVGLADDVVNEFGKKLRKAGEAAGLTESEAAQTVRNAVDAVENDVQSSNSSNNLENIIQDAKKRFCHATAPHVYFAIQTENAQGCRMPSQVSRQQIMDEFGSREGIGEKSLKQIMHGINGQGGQIVCHQPFMPTFMTSAEELPAINTATDCMPPMGDPSKYLDGPFRKHLEEAFIEEALQCVEDECRWAIQSILAGKPRRKSHGIYLMGDAGVGKDTLFELIGELLGCTATDIAPALFSEGGFNISQSEYLTYVSDTSIPSTRGVSFEMFKERIKEHVSAPKKSLANKNVKAQMHFLYGIFGLALNPDSRMARSLLINPTEEGFKDKFAMLKMNMSSFRQASQDDPEKAEEILQSIKDSLPDARAYFATTPIQSDPHFRYGFNPFVDPTLRQLALDANHVTDDLAYLEALIDAVNQTGTEGGINGTENFWTLSLKGIKEIHNDCLAKDFEFYKPTTQKLKPLIQRNPELDIQLTEHPRGTKTTTKYHFPKSANETE